MTPTVQAIAWTLIHFCWQAAAIAVIYRGLSALAARRSSNTRYLLALGALLLILANSIATFAFEMQTAPAAKFAAMKQIDSAASGATLPTGDARPDALPPSSGTRSLGSLLPALPALPLPFQRIMVGFWFAGVLVLSLRSLGGWWLIQRLRATATVEAPAAVRASFRRISSALGLHRPVLLRVSSAIAGPVTVGALRALVLLPLSAATNLGPAELEVVLAHELAHVRRADFLWNLVQTLVETLFFFHPAVWWLSSRVRHERELCCDDLALTVCPNPVVYANALFQLEQQRSLRMGQLAMALDGHQPARTLRMRIARILGEPIADTAYRGRFSPAAYAAVLVVLLLPVPQMLASLKPAAVPVRAQVAASVHTAVAAQVNAPSATVSSSPVSVAVQAPVVVSVQVPSSPDASPQSDEVAAASDPQQLAPKSDDGKGDYIDQMKAAGYDVDLDKYIAMKVQGITADYARSMSQLGFGKLSADDLIACKVQGVTAEYIAGLKQNGFEVKSIQDAISFHIFQVTPEFVASMKAAGFSGISSEQLLALRVQGITPEYARGIAQQFPGATADDLVKTRIFNIDAAFIALAKKHGFTDLSLDKLLKLRISGILDDNETK
jgi:beta-lactamase regulating signal transducer with metallopeptidase domain